MTREIFEYVGFKGLGSVEYKIRMDTEEPVIMEPTVGRTNYPHEISVLNGCNIPAACYYDLAFGEKFPVGEKTPPIKLIDGSAELKASWEYYKSGRLSVGQWLKDRSGRKKYMIFRYGDVLPFLATILKFFVRAVKKTGRIAKRHVSGN
jgi:hypothetical protein